MLEDQQQLKKVQSDSEVASTATGTGGAGGTIGPPAFVCLSTYGSILRLDTYYVHFNAKIFLSCEIYSRGKGASLSI